MKSMVSTVSGPVRGTTMKGQRTKNRFIYRRSWGAVRSRVRQRFAKENYDVEPGDLRAHDSWELHHYLSDQGRMRYLLREHKDRFRKIPWLLDWVIGTAHGDTSDLERMYGMFYKRCSKCGEKLYRFPTNNIPLGTPPQALCNRCYRKVENIDV